MRVGNYELVVTSIRTIRIDYPTGYSNHSLRYDDGWVVYDHPESVPKYVKRAVNRLYKEIA